MMIPKPTLVESTYKRDGKWYTLRVIDRSNQIETAATEDEIEKAGGSVAAAPKAAKVKKAKK
jgi:hypothetical protein